MFAIYLKDTMELLTSEERGSRTVLLGKALSRTHGRDVVAYYNGDNGNTEICCVFENGACTVQGPFCQKK
jgi:hypothetical protein